VSQHSKSHSLTVAMTRKPSRRPDHFSITLADNEFSDGCYLLTILIYQLRSTFQPRSIIPFAAVAELFPPVILNSGL